MKRLKEEKLFTIRAYCTKCKKLIQESNKMTRKELMYNWDKAVLDAPGMMCQTCRIPIPNFAIDLKIYNSGSKIEYKPAVLLPKPQKPADDLQSLLKVLSK